VATQKQRESILGAFIATPAPLTSAQLGVQKAALTKQVAMNKNNVPLTSVLGAQIQPKKTTPATTPAPVQKQKLVNPV
jgi:hypothetical protein